MSDVLVRVRVLETWDDFIMKVPPLTAVSEVKRRALETARIQVDPTAYMVKFRGAEVRDESRSLADEHVPDDGALIVMRRRRTPVR